jgi:rhodanese-related sulfurtransferase
MQINSPLEQMTLASPSCSSSIDSQGYFSDVFELQDTTSDDTLPKDFSSLLSSSLTKEDIPMKRTSLKRANANVEYSKASKRPSLCDTPSTMISPSKKSMKGSALFRCHSMVVPPCENAMFPDSPGEDTAEKIGDHSKPYLLPTIKGAIADLKSVTSDTVAAVVRGDYSDEADFDIIDCRYPYEYEGGHIMGAINIWEKPNLLDKYFSSPFHDSEKRHIIIFHCEFSSHRGPDMSRFMRQTDREKNGMNFPKLYFPELYLLDGGYKSFFSTHFDLCEPKLYKTMIDNNHKDDFRICSKKSKSWAGSRTTQRQQLSLRHRFSDFH